MTSISFTVPGKPEPQRRPRFARRGEHVTTHSDPKDLIYADRIRWAWREAGGGYLEGPLDLSVSAYFRRPKSHMSSRTLEYTTAGLIAEYVTKKPDMSNLVKAIEDALNGLAFSDDSQIVQFSPPFFKKWAPLQSDGWVDVKITELGP